jgi:CSLREA domain-containing protein
MIGLLMPRRAIGPKRVVSTVASVLLLFTLALAAPTYTTYAAGIVVNTDQDELNSDGDCSLREAIEASNTDTAVDACAAGSGADTITFAPALSGATIRLNSPLILGQDVTIDGSLLADRITLSGDTNNNGSRRHVCVVC